MPIYVNKNPHLNYLKGLICGLCSHLLRGNNSFFQYFLLHCAMTSPMDRKTSFVVVLVLCILSLATIICMFAFASGNPNVLCLEREREALLTFKQGIINHSNRLSSWIGEECCMWTGISCDNITARIIHLNLRHDPYDEYV